MTKYFIHTDDGVESAAFDANFTLDEIEALIGFDIDGAVAVTPAFEEEEEIDEFSFGGKVGEFRPTAFEDFFENELLENDCFLA